MNKAAGKKTAPRAIPTDFDGRAITGANLRAIIVGENVILDSGVPPSGKALDDLAVTVCLIRQRCRRGILELQTPDHIASDRLRRKASEALQTLAKVLPAIRAEYFKTPDLSPSELNSPMRLMELSQIDTLEGAVKEAQRYPCLTPLEELSIRVFSKLPRFSVSYALPPPSPIQDICTWHHFAAFLADKFRTVVQANCPKLDKGRSGVVQDATAAARFVAAVIPHITGEVATPENVRKWIYRHPPKIL